MSFDHPARLAPALLVALALALVYRWAERRRRSNALVYSDLRFVLEAVRPSRALPAALFAAWIAGVAAVGIALAGPHFVGFVPFKDGTVILCIDTSGSMSAADIMPTRETAAKSATLAFIDAMPAGTRVGIISFSSSASLIEPPTTDHQEAQLALERVPPPYGATAIGDALMLAAQQMPATGRRVIVLLTDGVNNHGVDPIEASAQIGQKGIAIYTIGVGSNGSGLFIPGTLEPADLDEGALRTLAQNGNGTYTGVADAGALQDAFRGLAQATVWERKPVDGSLAFAITGGVLLAMTLLVGLGAGRFP